MPSKFYGIASSGRPTLFIGAADGEIAQLLKRGQCGVTVAPGDAEGLADWIVRLQSDSAQCERMGRNARALLDSGYSQKHALDAWCQVLDEAKPDAERG